MSDLRAGEMPIAIEVSEAPRAGVVPDVAACRFCGAPFERGDFERRAHLVVRARHEKVCEHRSDDDRLFWRQNGRRWPHLERKQEPNGRQYPVFQYPVFKERARRGTAKRGPAKRGPKRGAVSEANPKRIDDRTRQAEAIRMRRDGKSLAVIVEALAFSDTSAASKAIARGARFALAEPSEQLRALETDRLDRIQAAFWARAIGGDACDTCGRSATEPDEFAADRVLKCVAQRCKLHGLDAASRLDLNVSAPVEIVMRVRGDQVDQADPREARLAEALATARAFIADNFIDHDGAAEVLAEVEYALQTEADREP